MTEKTTAYFHHMYETASAFGKAKAEREKEKDALIAADDWDAVSAWWEREKHITEPYTSGQYKAYWAFRNSSEIETGDLEMNDSLWEREVKDFSDTLKAAGVTTFVLTNQSTGLMGIQRLGGLAAGIAVLAAHVMILVGIYGDQGFSGLHADNRKEFQRLIADCEADKIDVVLVKSISRFSRNTVECQKYLQRLKEHGVAVLFEKEGLNSMDPQTDMILSIYASMAQAESCSHSENLRWALKQRAEMGNPARCARYGYRIRKKPGDSFSYWEIQEEEAKRIRYIFSLAYQGYAQKEIREMINQREAAVGGEPWTPERVRLTLLNEVYRGDILTNKTVVLDYLTKKCTVNKGQVEQYYLEQHHDPIVAPEVFDAVQEYMKQGYLNSRNKQLRAAWFREHPEVLKRRDEQPEVLMRRNEHSEALMRWEEHPEVLMRREEEKK